MIFKKFFSLIKTKYSLTRKLITFKMSNFITSIKKIRKDSETGPSVKKGNIAMTSAKDALVDELVKKYKSICLNVIEKRATYRFSDIKTNVEDFKGFKDKSKSSFVFSPGNVRHLVFKKIISDLTHELKPAGFQDLKFSNKKVDNDTFGKISIGYSVDPERQPVKQLLINVLVDKFRNICKKEIHSRAQKGSSTTYIRTDLKLFKKHFSYPFIFNPWVIRKTVFEIITGKGEELEGFVFNTFVDKQIFQKPSSQIKEEELFGKIKIFFYVDEDAATDELQDTESCSEENAYETVETPEAAKADPQDEEEEDEDEDEDEEDEDDENEDEEEEEKEKA